MICLWSGFEALGRSNNWQTWKGYLYTTKCYGL